jgi:hypothetical protein
MEWATRKRRAEYVSTRDARPTAEPVCEPALGVEVKAMLYPSIKIMGPF